MSELLGAQLGHWYEMGQLDLIHGALFGRRLDEDDVPCVIGRTNWVHFALWCVGANLAIAGGLEMQRRYGQWDREGYARDKP